FAIPARNHVHASAFAPAPPRLPPRPLINRALRFFALFSPTTGGIRGFSRAFENRPTPTPSFTPSRADSSPNQNYQTKPFPPLPLASCPPPTTLSTQHSTWNSSSPLPSSSPSASSSCSSISS